MHDYCAVNRHESEETTTRGELGIPRLETLSSHEALRNAGVSQY